jgi:POT family proton-dependent oligopeptide transporter
MRALLILFLTSSRADGGLAFDTRRAASVYSTYTSSVYLLCILGGYFADNFIGARRAVLGGSVIIAAGHLSMALGGDDSLVLLYGGLALVAIGTGLLKPSVSSMVGQLYAADDARRDGGFAIFYMGINIGALFAPIVCGYLAQGESFRAFIAAAGFDARSSWNFGFAAAGAGMLFGLGVFWMQIGRLAHVGNAPAVGVDLFPSSTFPHPSSPHAPETLPFPQQLPRPWAKLALVALASIALVGLLKLSESHPAIVAVLYGVQLGGIVFFAFRRAPDGPDAHDTERQYRQISAILVLFCASSLFWALFDQAGSTVELFADTLTRNEIFGAAFPSSYWQSVNSLFVIALAPAFSYLWSSLGPRQPSSPAKFALALVFASLSFALMWPAAALSAGGRVSPLWLLGLFLLQTIGEMLLSPVGLSTMTKLAPPHLVGLVMGVWFLGAALGGKLAGTLSAEFTDTDPDKLARFFLHQALIVGACAAALFVLVPWVKRLMGAIS